MEDERYAVARQEGAQLSAANIVLVGDDGELAGQRGIGADPLVQEVGDRQVKELVTGTPRRPPVSCSSVMIARAVAAARVVTTR
jgi:hypothetical protein